MQTFGEVLRSERKKRNRLSQSDLGEALGVSQQTIANWENNRAVPEPDRLLKLRQYFGEASPLYGIDPQGLTHHIRHLTWPTGTDDNRMGLSYYVDPGLLPKQTHVHLPEEPDVQIHTESYSERPRQAPAATASRTYAPGPTAVAEDAIAKQLPERMLRNVNRYVQIGTRPTRFFYLSERIAITLSVVYSVVSTTNIAQRQLVSLMLLNKLHPVPNRVAAMFLVNPADPSDERDERRIAAGISTTTFEAGALGVRVYQVKSAEDAAQLLIELDSGEPEYYYTAFDPD